MWFSGVLGGIHLQWLMPPLKKQEQTQGMQLWMMAGTESSRTLPNFFNFQRSLASQRPACWRRTLLQEIYQKLLWNRTTLTTWKARSNLQVRIQFGFNISAGLGSQLNLVSKFNNLSSTNNCDKITSYTSPPTQHNAIQNCPATHGARYHFHFSIKSKNQPIRTHCKCFPVHLCLFWQFRHLAETCMKSKIAVGVMYSWLFCHCYQ